MMARFVRNDHEIAIGAVPRFATEALGSGLRSVSARLSVSARVGCLCKGGRTLLLLLGSTQGGCLRSRSDITKGLRPRGIPMGPGFRQRALSMGLHFFAFLLRQEFLHDAVKFGLARRVCCFHPGWVLSM